MRLFRWCLHLCPRALREGYGAAMEATFASRLAEVRSKGPCRRARFWGRELAAVFALAVAARFGDLVSRRRRRRRYDSQRKAGCMEGFGQELRHAARRLARSPAFTL